MDMAWLSRQGALKPIPGLMAAGQVLVITAAALSGPLYGRPGKSVGSTGSRGTIKRREEFLGLAGARRGHGNALISRAPRVGIEPTTNGLTDRCVGIKLQ
jgi:hypothetical protein